MLTLCPSMLVVILGPEFNSWPLRLQEIVIGKSPCDTTHVSCAKTPVLTTGGKEKGAMTGGSKKENGIRSKGVQTFPVPSLCNLLNTIHIQFCRVCDRARRVAGSTGVLPNVGVVNAGYDQHARSPAQHRRGDAGP